MSEEKTFNLVLSKEAASALFAAMGGAQVKGETQVDLHARVIRALKASFVDESDRPIGGACVLNEDRVQYLKKTIAGVIENGVNGHFAVGLSEVNEQLKLLTVK